MIKKSNKTFEKCITISIFQTGRVLFSGIHEDYQTPLIEWFLNLVHEVKDDIKTINNSSFSLVKYLRPSYLYPAI